MRNLVFGAMFAGALAVSSQVSAAGSSDLKPTIVLVHGAFAGSSSWNGVITQGCSTLFTKCHCEH